MTTDAILIFNVKMAKRLPSFNELPCKTFQYVCIQMRNHNNIMLDARFYLPLQEGFYFIEGVQNENTTQRPCYRILIPILYYSYSFPILYSESSMIFFRTFTH